MNLEELWGRLGLDSLNDTSRTHTETFGAEETYRPPVPAPVSPAPDIRLSMTPPPPAAAGPTDVQPEKSDLVVVGRLGEGGMGTVLQARQPSLSRDVAVKVPRNAGAGSRSLVEEARLTGSLEHPGIVPVHAIAFDQAGSPALVMRLVDGVSWSTLLLVPDRILEERLGRSAPNRLEAHLHVFLQVCNAIAFAHGRGVLHRDVKPANVLIGLLGEVYVADWGVARRKDAPPGPTGLKGTPAYLAPEMCTGDDTVIDERTDVFLLGATLYEVIEGNPPYYRAAGVAEAVAAAWHAVFPPLPHETPEELDGIVTKAMAYEKAERFQTVLELRDAVANYLRHAASHRLAAKARHALVALEKAVREKVPREQFAPLATGCRFGFMHALAEWEGNAEAKSGLEESLKLCVRYELDGKNAAAARTLLTELKAAPPELTHEVEQLEQADEEVSRVAKRYARVARDFDPAVAMRQRVVLLLSIGAGTVLATLGPQLIPAWGDFDRGLGRWQLLARLPFALVAFAVFALVYRRGLLGTRLNRRFMGALFVSLTGLVANRALAAALGIPQAQTLLLDVVVLSTVGAALGFLLHAGYFLQPVIGAATLLAALALPGHEMTLYSLAVVGALLLTLVTWTRWRSELA
ncbi:MAG: serine/threonine protein kinase [Myxococcaceae bacterium]|nr:serine/threonine protein kinase [Myxococcaceae bacterium]